MDFGSGAICQLLSDVSPLETCNNVKSVRPYYASDLLDGNIGVAPQVRDISGVMLVREDQAHGVAVPFERLIDAPNPELKFLDRCHVFAVDGSGFGENLQDFIQVATMQFGSRSGVHEISVF